MVTSDGSGQRSRDQQTPARRSILRSIGAAGATAAVGAGATGTAGAASNSVGQLARSNATETRAREAFETADGTALLRELSKHGYIESASYDALNVDDVTAARSFSTDWITVTEVRHDEAGAVVGFVAKLENETFDGPITVRLYPDADVAGATAERDGESVVLSPGYDGFRPQSSVEPASCNSCSGHEDICTDHDCDCGRVCTEHDDMNGKYTAHTVCSDGRVECGDCSLCCGTCGW
ncbi:hypothetical protein [Natrinema salaciae]|uniref:Uncharacterized protein n=1 Tax=Natrinema salaciae TaxID=1186196 RepID=A0A1H9MWU6_9EURY|nr:hypothetical protein [Natrinema salaciae]SER28174.1 hypothetical protein SAMN04489841_3533 [Natrinema salaciae]